MPVAPDLCIVGGGLIGTATAYYAALAGLRVVLYEERALGSGASGAAFGGVSTSVYSYASARVPDAYVALSKASVAEYHRLRDTLGAPLDFVTPGCLDPFGASDWDSRAERVAGLRSCGIEVELLDLDRVREIEPAIEGGLAGAIYAPADGHVTPMQAVWAFADGARRHGADLRTGVRVDHLVTRGDDVVGVSSSEGSVAAGCTLVACGLGTPKLLEALGVSIPLAVSRGQMVVTERVPPLLRTFLHTIKQTPYGTIVMGATREPEENLTATTVAGTREMMAEFTTMVPALERVRVLRSWAGIRPVPVDGYPVLGSVPGVGGLLVAVMHRGVTLAPIVGSILAGLAEGRAPDHDIAGFSVSRFQAA